MLEHRLVEKHTHCVSTAAFREIKAKLLLCRCFEKLSSAFVQLEGMKNVLAVNEVVQFQRQNLFSVFYCHFTPLMKEN